MSTGGYKITNQEAMYFVSFAVVDACPTESFRRGCFYWKRT